MPKAKRVVSSVKKNVSNLEQLRGELEGKAKQVRADVKRELKSLERTLTPIRRAAEKSAADVKVASEQFLSTVKRGYDRILRSMAS